MLNKVRIALFDRHIFDIRRSALRVLRRRAEDDIATNMTANVASRTLGLADFTGNESSWHVLRIGKGRAKLMRPL